MCQYHARTIIVTESRWAFLEKYPYLWRIPKKNYYYYCKVKVVGIPGGYAKILGKNFRRVMVKST